MLTKKQLAERWQVSESTINRFMKTNQLHPVKIGRFVRFRESDVEAYENDHTQPVVFVSRNKREVVNFIV